MAEECRVGELAQQVQQAMRMFGLDKLSGQVAQMHSQVVTRLDDHSRQLKEHDARIGGMGSSIMSIQQDMRELKEEVGRQRAATASWPTGSSGTSASSASSSGVRGSAGEPFIPSVVLVRGFAPYNEPGKNKLSKEDAGRYQRELLDKLDSGIRPRVRAMECFAWNHQLAFRVSGGRGSCDEVVQKFQALFDANVVTIRERKLKASIECSPQRKKAWALFKRAEERLRKANVPDTSLVECTRLLQWWPKEQTLVGQVDWVHEAWKWEATGLAELGLDIKDFEGAVARQPAAAAAGVDLS